MRRVPLSAVVIALALILSVACGGGGGGGGESGVELRLDAITPDADSAMGGWPFVVVGAGFADGVDLSVRFGDVSATEVVRVSSSRVEGELPALAPGIYDVTVVDGDGRTTVRASAYRALQELSLASAPMRAALVGMNPDYRFPIIARDAPELSWTLVRAPAGMELQPIVGEPPYLATVDWTPTAQHDGVQEVELIGLGSDRIVHLAWDIEVFDFETLASALITTAGGGVVEVDTGLHPGLGVRVEIPPGAAPEDGVYAIRRRTGGRADRVGEHFELTPHGLLASQFTTNDKNALLTNYRALVTFPYTQEMVDASGITPGSEADELGIVHRDEVTGEPELLSPIDVDTTAKRITVETPHFGYFSVSPQSITGSTTIDTHGTPQFKKVAVVGTTTFFPGDKNLLVLHGFKSGFESALESGKWNGLIRWMRRELDYDNIVLLDYPWLSGVRANGAVLAESYTRHTSARFDILAHSMGGLVARWAIEECGLDLVDHLITIGTPHEGTGVMHTMHWWAFGALTELGALGLGLGSASREVTTLTENSRAPDWASRRNGTSYCFVAGQIPGYTSLGGLFGVAGDGVVPVDSALADSGGDLGARRVLLRDGDVFSLGGMYFRGYPEHGDLYKQIATNGVGHVVYDELYSASLAHAGGFDIDSDGDVDLDDYELVLTTFVQGYDPRNQLFTRPRSHVMRRWGVSQSTAEAWLSRTDVNGDFLYDDDDRRFMETWAVKQYLVRWRDQDISIWQSEQSTNYSNIPVGVGPEHGQHWHALIRFSGIVPAVFDGWTGSTVPGLDARLMLHHQQIMSEMFQTIDVHEVTSAWTESGATWNNRPSVGTRYYSTVVANDANLLGGIQDISQHNGGLDEAVKHWLAGTNHGLQLSMAVSASYQTVWYPDRNDPVWMRTLKYPGQPPLQRNFGVCLLLEANR